MDNDIIIGADTAALFCRLNMNTKRDIPVRPSEMGVLIYIFTERHSVTPLMISKFFRISKPSVTSIVNVLIKNEYLIKVPSAKDGRSYVVEVTNKGKELVEATYNEYYKTMELLKKKLGDKEYHLFIEMLQMANNILGEENNNENISNRCIR